MGVTVLDWGWVQHTCPVLQYLVSSVMLVMLNVDPALTSSR